MVSSRCACFCPDLGIHGYGSLTPPMRSCSHFSSCGQTIVGQTRCLDRHILTVTSSRVVQTRHKCAREVSGSLTSLVVEKFHHYPLPSLRAVGGASGLMALMGRVARTGEREGLPLTGTRCFLGAVHLFATRLLETTLAASGWVVFPGHWEADEVRVVTPVCMTSSAMMLRVVTATVVVAMLSVVNLVMVFTTTLTMTVAFHTLFKAEQAWLSERGRRPKRAFLTPCGTHKLGPQGTPRVWFFLPFAFLLRCRPHLVVSKGITWFGENAGCRETVSHVRHTPTWSRLQGGPALQ